MLGIVACMREALKGGRVWWLAPTYKQALEGWLYLQRITRTMAVQRSATELLMSFDSGGSIQVRTADNPDSLRGAGLSGVVLDEAATMKRETWDEVLQPALADKGGWAMFISTPQHFNWFYDLFEKGEAGEKDWASWQYPTWNNPYIPEAEIEVMRSNMLEEDFDQEVGASFTAVGGAIFRLLSANRPIYLRPMPAGLDFQRTGVGMDWGTTPQHQASVVCDSITSAGVVWRRSVWLDHTGSSDAWRDEAVRCKRDHGATFACVDRSQSSELDRLRSVGLTALVGNPHVDVRIGEEQALIMRKAIFFDSNAPGMREHFNRMCAYHRDKEGKVVEEEDDDIDAGCYIDSELTKGNPGGGTMNQGVKRYAAPSASRAP